MLALSATKCDTNSGPTRCWARLGRIWGVVLVSSMWMRVRSHDRVFAMIKFMIILFENLHIHVNVDAVCTRINEAHRKQDFSARASHSICGYCAEHVVAELC